MRLARRATWMDNQNLPEIGLLGCPKMGGSLSPWVKDSVRALFDREAGQFYMGNMVYIGEKERKKSECEQDVQIQRNTHEAIISTDLHDRAKAARNERTHAGNVFSTTNRVYLLGEGIAHCEHCGRPLRSITGAKSNGKHRYYRCCAWMRAEQCSGSRAQIREDALMPQVDAYIASLTMPARWQDRVREMLRKE
jgi:Recombinase zinc beta ribbon domain/Recombinase